MIEVMAEKIYHYPLWIRLWHLANALFCLILIISGVSMQFSEPDSPLIRFDLAVTLHNSVAILLTINYLFFIITNSLSGNRKYYRISERNYFGMLLAQFRYYTSGLFKNEKAPFPVSAERKFNPLQQFSYIIIMYGCMPLIMLTGWAMLFPEIIIKDVFGISGLFLTDLLHIINGFIVSIFLIIHVYFCTMGTKLSSTFKGMINGWAEVH
jgi:thiosulfate reductase cytochrome b subunit